MSSEAPGVRTRRSLDGLVMAWEAGDTLSQEVLGPVFGRLPRCAPDTPAHLDWDLRVQPTELPKPHAPEAEPVLYHAHVSAYRVPDGGYWVSDGASRLEVSADGRRVEARLHERSRRDLQVLGNVLVQMAACLALRFHGWFHLHAGAVRCPSGQVALILGDSGAGKSTTTLSLIRAGAQWLGDDTLFLREAAVGLPRVAAQPRDFHLTDRTLEMFPTLRESVRPTTAGSTRPWSLDPTRFGAGITGAHGPFVLLCPAVDAARPTAAERLETGDAFGALLTSSAWAAIDNLPGTRAQLALLGALASQGRAYRLWLGPDMLARPERLAEVVFEVANSGFP